MMQILNMCSDVLLHKENFKRIKWADVRNGECVYIAGTRLGNFRAYGPHRVQEKKHRVLRNSQNMTFTHAAEDLIILQRT